MDDIIHIQHLIAMYEVIAQLTGVCSKMNDDNNKILEENFMLSEQLKRLKNDVYCMRANIYAKLNGID